ncbi:MAG TPA: hypothetical protein IGQ15_03245 [Thermosynechococcus sp. M98_K2018_005]|nr:hypothetical protein [Thermosynechococcus sp. M98_K2018_005]HIK47519.1 hypothetical protein [Thermosynechococcus sp. M55_K2018_012]
MRKKVQGRAAYPWKKAHTSPEQPQQIKIKELSGANRVALVDVYVVS